MTAHESPVLFQTQARGKLLLTGEYFVLDGALALAMPVTYGQELRVEKGEKLLIWQSLEKDGSLWFAAQFLLPDLEIQQTTEPKIADILVGILAAIRRQNPAFLTDLPGYRITTQVDFPRSWGLGTSSTLIAALARWANVDPYRVLAETLGGSGYDLACAYAEGPVFYHVENAVPSVEPVDFSPAFADQLFFVFLGKKQNSRLGIAHYRALPGKTRAEIEEVSQLTRRFTAATTLPEFEQVIAEHETFVQQKLDLPKVREGLFPDYWGEIKSLGAWGGDFVLVTSNRSLAETQTFFNEKGYPVFIPYAEMTVSPPHLSF